MEMLWRRFGFGVPAMIVCTIVLSAADNVILDDRYFDPLVYQQLAEFGETDAWRVDAKQYPAGRRLSRREVARIALTRFLQQAASLGIAEREITRAMFEGRLNPMWTFRLVDEREAVILTGPGDVDLVFEGLGAPQYRSAEWNRRFGAIWEIDAVETIVDEAPVRMTGRDLMTRLHVRLTTNSDLERWYGIKQNPGVRYESLRAHILAARGERRAAFLDQQLVELEDPEFNSAYFYFMRGSKPDPSMDLEKDYAMLRRLKFAKLLTERMLKELDP